MRLILFDVASEKRRDFYPIALSRPLWEMRCGMTSLGEKLIAKTGASDVAYFVPDYMAESYRTRTDRTVNDASVLAGDELLAVNPRLKAAGFDVAAAGPGEVGRGKDGEVMYVRAGQADLPKLKAESIEGFLEAACRHLPVVECDLPTWKYTWDLVLSNPAQLAEDFAAAGRSGVEGTVEQPGAVRGSAGDVYVAPGAHVHPMVVLDAANGPIYIDRDVEIHPFTRVEGPCYVGRKSVLLGAKCREGMSIGPVCRVGGEVEESILQGYSNKYHDGFLGHAYVGEWVNLGALTTNSDLKNDYSSVSVQLGEKLRVDTGSTKVGSLIGDHTKTSIGTLLNTGAYVGAMTVLMATGKPLPKYIPSFTWLIEGVATKGFGKGKLYETAEVAMGRRGRTWTPAERAMWDAVFEMTAPERNEAIQRGRRRMRKS